MSNHKNGALPTRDQLQIWRGFYETIEALRGRLGTRLQTESGLSSGDYTVLLTLNEAPDRTLRSSELAESIGWERSRLSHHLGRMERRGLIERMRCPSNVHGVDVALTDQGYSAFRAGAFPHMEAIRELFIDALSPDQLKQVEDLTRSLRKHLELDSSS